MNDDRKKAFLDAVDVVCGECALLCESECERCAVRYTVDSINRKIYYPMETALNNIFAKLGIKRNTKHFTEWEIELCADMLDPLIEWVEHPDYIQAVPKLKSTGELILD